MSKIVFIGEARAALAPVGPHCLKGAVRGEVSVRSPCTEDLCISRGRLPGGLFRLQTNLRISGSALSTNRPASEVAAAGSILGNILGHL